MNPGKFITFEGPEGAGKTTHARKLVARLEALGRPVLYTREPGGTRTGEAIRDILQHDKAGEPLFDEAEVLLFSASRAQLVRQVILPALARGATVISDRFADSTTAYQGCGRELGIENMLAINAFAIGAAVPDLTILLDLDVRIGFQRLTQRNAATGTERDRIERETLEFHERVRSGYHELVRRFPQRFKVLNADRDAETVDAEIWSLVRDVIC